MIAWVFLYGTLLDRRVFLRRAGTARPFRRGLPARLPGFRRVALRGTPYPTLVADEGEVAGWLVALPSAPLARLQAYEGASYRLVPVRVMAKRGARRVRAWAAPRWRANPGRGWVVT